MRCREMGGLRFEVQSRGKRHALFFICDTQIRCPNTRRGTRSCAACASRRGARARASGWRLATYSRYICRLTAARLRTDEYAVGARQGEGGGVAGASGVRRRAGERAHGRGGAVDRRLVAHVVAHHPLEVAPGVGARLDGRYREDRRGRLRLDARALRRGLATDARRLALEPYSPLTVSPRSIPKSMAIFDWLWMYLGARR